MKNLITALLFCFVSLNMSLALAKPTFYEMAWYQQAYYWGCLTGEGCLDKLLAVQYEAYATCAINCFDQAVAFNGVAWCTDSDGMKFFEKGMMKSSYHPKGIEDYCYTFAGGKTYLFEIACAADGGYMHRQVNCAYFGSATVCQDGACVDLNEAPVIDPMEIADIFPDELTQFALTADDPNGQSLTWSAENLPTGASFDENGVFSWQPGCGDAGYHDITVNVSDGQLDDSAILTLYVADMCQTWYRAFGGSGYEIVYDVIEVSGGFVFTGLTNSAIYGATAEDIWLAKTDESGNLLWSKVWGGYSYDCGRAVVQTPDLGLVVCGFVTVKNAFGDWRIVKTDSAGAPVWSFGDGGNKGEGCYDIVMLNDGSFVAVGVNASAGAGSLDAWVMGLDENGNKSWQQVLGGTGVDEAQAVIQDSEGNIVVAGEKDVGNGELETWLLKFDAAGTLLWDNLYGVPGDDIGFDLIETSDGGYLIGGSRHVGADLDLLLLKIDVNGDEQWSQTYGGAIKELGFSVAEHFDGGYLLAGKSTSVSGSIFNMEPHLIKTDADGGLEWTRSWSGTENDSLETVLVFASGHIIIAGNIGKQALMIKAEEKGYAPKN